MRRRQPGRTRTSILVCGLAVATGLGGALVACSSDPKPAAVTTTTQRGAIDPTYCEKVRAVEVRLALFVRLDLHTTSLAAFRSAVASLGEGVAALASLTADLSASDRTDLQRAMGKLDGQSQRMASDADVVSSIDLVDANLVVLKLALDRATGGISCPVPVAPR